MIHFLLLLLLLLLLHMRVLHPTKVLALRGEKYGEGKKTFFFLLYHTFWGLSNIEKEGGKESWLGKTSLHYFFKKKNVLLVEQSSCEVPFLPSPPPPHHFLLVSRWEGRENEEEETDWFFFSLSLSRPPWRALRGGEGEDDCATPIFSPRPLLPFFLKQNFKEKRKKILTQFQKEEKKKNLLKTVLRAKSDKSWHSQVWAGGRRTVLILNKFFLFYIHCDNFPAHFYEWVHWVWWLLLFS